jgi:peptide/nickel transport system substrate-binding protein
MAINQGDNVRVTVFESPYIYNMLTGDMFPLLADGPFTWNEARTEITFMIKAAAKWSDGTPVTAYDVAYTWASNIKYETDAGNNYKDYIDSIIAVDAQTVRVKAKLDQDGKAVNPLMVAAYLSNNYVIQKAWTKKVEARTGGDPDAFRNDPGVDFIASGPYPAYISNSQIVVLIRNDNYWGKDVSMWGKLPVPKYLAHVIYADNPAGDAAFKAGEVDVSQQFINNVQDLWLVDHLPISTYLPDAPYMVGAMLPTAFYNLASYGLDNVTIRKAIAIAVDYDLIVADAMSNQSATFEQFPRSIMNPSPYEQALYDHDAVAYLQWTGNDIDGAKALLNAAGIIDTNGDGNREFNGQELHYVATCPNGWSDWQAAIEIVAAAGRAIGIDITTNYPEWDPDYQNAVTNWPLPDTGYDIFMMWSDGAGPTQPWGRIWHMMSSDFAHTTGNWSGNWGGYINPDADALIRAIPGETDPAVLKADYTELTRIYLSDIPSFTLMYRPQAFHTVNESVWTNFPHQGDSNNPPIPPLDCTDGYSIACLYDLTRVPPKVVPGEPGLSYRYMQTYGETQVPYISDSVHLNGPEGLFMDGTNNLFVAETAGHRVLRYEYGEPPTNTWAIGSAGNSGWDIGWGEYIFQLPRDVALDSSGNVWVADSNRVVEYTSAGIYIQDYFGDENHSFNDLFGIAFDSAGRMFVSSAYDQEVQVYDLTSSSPVYSTTIGGGESGMFNQPRRIAIDSADQLYVADSGNGRVQKCAYSSGWSCETLDSGLNSPQGLVLDSSDNVYIADTENARIRKCDPSGVCGDFVPNTFGFLDLAVDTYGNVYGTTKPYEPNYNSVIVKYDNTGQWGGYYLGEPNIPYVADGSHYNRPKVSIDADQNILITEEWGQRLVKLNPQGNFLWSFGVTGVPGWDNDHFSTPVISAADSSGKIYVPDLRNCRVQIISPTGNYINTLGTGCGNGQYQFNNAFGVAIDKDGNIYVADTDNQRVMIYDIYRDYIGQIGETGVCDVANNHLCRPEAVAVDSTGNIYVADYGNNRVQKFNGNHEWLMTIGNGTYGNQFDQFARPNAITVDAQGKIYVSEWENPRVEVFDPSGAYLTTIGGARGTSSAQFAGITSVAVDGQGNVYVSDVGHRIQKYAPGVPNWNQVNLNGFGNRNVEQLPSLGVFNGYLYAGTSNYTDGAYHIYRSLNGHDWEMVNNNFDGGVSGLIAFDNQLFAGTWNGSIYSSPDGLIWTQELTGVPPIASFSLFNNTLYAGTYSNNCPGEGASIWQTPDGITWTPFVTNGNGDPSACGVISSAEFDGNLYFGVGDWSGNTGGRIWRTDGTNITEVVGDGFGNPANMDPGGLAVLGEAIYASIDIPNGYQVWRSYSGDPGSWSKVLEINRGEDEVGTLDGLIVLDDHLFLTTQNEPKGMQVWITADGLSWQQVGFEGLGDSNNTSAEWSNSSAIFKGQLYIGVTNHANAGEIWRYEPMVTARFTAVPTVGIAPLQVTFTNTSSGTLTASMWTFGDGKTSTDTSPVHTYDAAGVYTVTLTADSFGNTDTITKAKLITVYAPVSANFSANPISGPVPLTVAFTNLSTGNFDTCLWNFGDTTTSTLCNPPEYVYLSPGVYTVTLTASGLGGSDIETKIGYITVENLKFFLPVVKR